MSVTFMWKMFRYVEPVLWINNMKAIIQNNNAWENVNFNLESCFVLIKWRPVWLLLASCVLVGGYELGRWQQQQSVASDAQCCNATCTSLRGLWGIKTSFSMVWFQLRLTEGADILSLNTHLAFRIAGEPWYSRCFRIWLIFPSANGEFQQLFVFI